MARDLFTFGHFPIVTGILAYAVVVKHMVADPKATLPYADRWLLIAAIVMLVGGCLQIQWQVMRPTGSRTVRRRSPPSAMWLLVGASLPGWAAVAGIAVDPGRDAGDHVAPIPQWRATCVEVAGSAWIASTADWRAIRNSNRS